MRYVLLSLSAICCISLFSCKSKDSDPTIKEMSAKFRPYAIDTASGQVWNANPNLVKATVKYKDSKGYAISFSGSDYETLNTNLELFIQDFKGDGNYPLYRAASSQSDSNYARLVYKSKSYYTVSGNLQMLRSTGDTYIADFDFVAVYQSDTLAVTNGHFTISK